jgi:hypothetical protein
MRPYYAVVLDSFRMTLRSPVLWILVSMITFCLFAMAPLGAREETHTDLRLDDVSNWRELGLRMESAYKRLGPSPGKRIWGEIEPELRVRIVALELPTGGDLAARQQLVATVEQFRQRLNTLLRRPDFFDEASWEGVRLSREARELKERGVASLSSEERDRFHRLALESAFPDLIRTRLKTSYILSYGPWEPIWPGPLPIAQKEFHKLIGSAVTWASDILVGLVVIFVAVLATAPIVPRMFDQGQLHLLLSKPVSRSLLLLSQFCGGCAYVLVLTTYLLVGLWLILGTRMAYWDLRLLWMIPLYTFMFAIYYTVSVAAGVIWRSTLMSVVCSVLFFLMCFSLGTSKVTMDGLLTLQRVVQIVPAGSELLVVNERGVLSRWNESEQTWEVTFLPKEMEGIGNLATFMPANLRSIGPVYTPRKEAIVAVQYPAIDNPGRWNVLPQFVALGYSQSGWSHQMGRAAPTGTFGLFVEPDGTVLLTSHLGISRIVRDPTQSTAPPRVFGFALPLPAASPFADAGPAEGVEFPMPAKADFHPPTRQLVVFSQRNLWILTPDAEERYAVQRQTELDVAEGESIALAASGERILVGRADGRLQLYGVGDLREQSTHVLEPASAPRFLAASADGRFAVVFHNDRLWTFDPATAAWQRPRVTGQGEISAATYDGEDLYVADRTSRISRYDARDFQLRERRAPRLDYFQGTYYYVVRPLYTVLPKPGELGKTMQYLVTGQETADTGDREARDEVTALQTRLNPWAPVWSGLAFMAVVLTATCVYFERQEY